MKENLAIFEDYKIRRLYDENSQTWFFSVVDIVRALTQQPDYQAARNYWKVLKNRLRQEGSQTVTNCNQLKMHAEDIGSKDGKQSCHPAELFAAAGTEDPKDRVS